MPQEIQVQSGGAGADTIAGSGSNGNPFPKNGSRIPSGLDPLDERIGGLRAGGTYLLAGLPGSGRFTALLQFLSRGLDEGRVGLVTAAPRGRVFEEAGHWGFDLEAAWKEGRMGLLSYKADFQRRLLASAEPGEVLNEMSRLLGPEVRRLALYPAGPFWGSRSGTALASRVMGWLDEFPATTLAAVGGDLLSATTPALEWAVDAATGVLVLENGASAVHELSIRRLSPPADGTGPISLHLEPGRGYVTPSGRLDRRAEDAPSGAERRVLLIRLAPAVPAELAAWLDRWYETTAVDSPFEAVERIQEEAFGLVLVHLSREKVDAALQAVRALRGLSPVPILLVTGQKVRAKDRIRALEAGASDFLSDPLSVGELASRAERAVIAGAPPRRPARRGEKPHAAEDEQAFADRVQSRLSDSRGSLLTFVRIPLEAASPHGASLREILAREIRDADGDLLGELSGGIGLVLQGTDVSQAGAFLDRVRGLLGGHGTEFQVEVLSGTVDADRIRELLSGGPR